MILTLIAALAVQAPAASAPAPAVCTPGAPLPAPYAAWQDAHPVGHGFVIGRAVDLPVRTMATVTLPAQPSKPLPGGRLAIARFEVTTAGRYAVAVGGATAKLRPLWLDIVGKGDAVLKSVGHGHGPDCSSITKIVEFNLVPGKYALLASGLPSGSQTVRALVVPRS